MSAVVGAMAGGIAGAMERRALLNKLRNRFLNDQDYNVSCELLDLLQESKDGNPILTVVIFLVAFIAMFTFASIGDSLSGDTGAIIGAFLGVAVCPTGEYFLNGILRKKAQSKLQRLIETDPKRLSLILTEVKKIAKL